MNQAKMNTTPAPLAINSLVLCKLTSASPTVSVLHKAASAKAAAQAGADRKKVRTHVDLVERAGTAIGAAASLVQTTQTAIRRYALPCFAVEGASYVMASDVDTVQAIFDEAAAKLVGIREDLKKQWPDLVAAARMTLGALAFDMEWPTAEEFAARFKLSLTWLGVPAPITGTPLEAVSNETAARVRASSEKAVRDDLLAAHAAPIRDLLRELVGTPSEKGAIEQIAHGKRIRRERFDALVAAADEIAAKNWLRLPELDALVAEVRGKVDGLDGLTAADHAGREAAVYQLRDAKLAAESTLAALGL